MRKVLLRSLSALLFTSFLFIAGCAQLNTAGGDFSSVNDFWKGRLSVLVASDSVAETEQPKSFIASFELSGNAETGELLLLSPLGSTIARLLWQPGRATLQQGGQERVYASLDELAELATGTPLPVAVLFAWLHGQPQEAGGWKADLSRLKKDGRLTARRLTPSPAAELRVVLERQE